jgi:hypothetical protein
MLVTGKTKKTTKGWFVQIKDLSLKQKLYPIAKPQLPVYPKEVTVELIPNTTEESDEQVEYTARIFNNLN